jgi:hypothetical protein
MNRKAKGSRRITTCSIGNQLAQKQLSETASVKNFTFSKNFY